MRIKVGSETKRINSLSCSGVTNACGPLDVVRDQLNDDIDVFCEPQIPVRADRQSPGDQKSDASRFERRGKCFKAGEFHVLSGLVSADLANAKPQNT